MSHERKAMPHRFTVRFDEKEYLAIAQDADVAGLSAAAYIRAKCRGRRVAAKADLKILAELRRIGGLLKHIHNETKGAYSANTAAAIREITRYVQQMNEDFSSNRNRKQ